jgi:hypothetical protein
MLLQSILKPSKPVASNSPLQEKIAWQIMQCDMWLKVKARQGAASKGES